MQSLVSFLKKSETHDSLVLRRLCKYSIKAFRLHYLESRMKTHLRKRWHPYIRIGLIILIVAVVLIALLKRARAEVIYASGMMPISFESRLPKHSKLRAWKEQVILL